MAKRTRVPVRGKTASNERASSQRKARKAGPHKTARSALHQGTESSIPRTANATKARRAVYTPDALAYARHRYEQTGASLADIAVDLRVHADTVRKLANREGWVRYVRPPRALPTAVRLAMQAGELEAQAQGSAAGEQESPGDAVQPKTEEGGPNADTRGAMPRLASTVARLYRAVQEELAAVETLRAQLKREPQSRYGAESTARTLSSLTETLQKLQRLQCAVPQSGSHDDDMPADIDEFRRELARRIEAFVASRSGRRDDDGSIASSMDAATR